MEQHRSVDGLPGFAPVSTTNGLNSSGPGADSFSGTAVIGDPVTTPEVTVIATTRGSAMIDVMWPGYGRMLTDNPVGSSSRSANATRACAQG